MPYQYTEPEVVVEHKGVTVYYTYKYDDINQPYEYWYTLDLSEQDEDFDIRDFYFYNPDITPKQALILAIDKGLLKQKEEVL